MTFTYTEKNTVYEEKRELKKEMIKPSVPKMPYKCAFCGITYTLPVHLSKHLLDFHGEMLDVDDTKKLIKKKDIHVPRQRKSDPLGKSHNCPFCNFTSFRGQLFLDKHIEEDHGGKKLAGYYCEICKSLYDEKNVLCHDLQVSETLDFHTLDEKMYDYLICGICDDKKFLSKEGLADHVSTFHEIPEKTEPILKPIRFMANEDQKIYKCSICSKNFITMHGLDEHFTSEHEGRQLSQEIENSFPQKPKISPSQNLKMVSILKKPNFPQPQKPLRVLKPNFPQPQKPLRVLKPKMSYSKNISLIQKPMIPITGNLTVPLPSKPTLPTWLPSPSSLGLRF